jgi:hypothetical protein
MGVLKNFLHERFAQALHQRLWAGEKQSVARLAAYREHIYRGTNPDDRAILPNTRKLCAQPDVKARLMELAQRSATIAELDAGWGMVKLKKLVEHIEGFNLDDFLGPANEHGRRYYDLSEVPREKLAILSELSIQDTTTVVDRDDGLHEIHHNRTMKLKGPAKTDAIGPLALMARIGGWEAPKKIAPTDTDGNDLAIADLVAASMALVEERRRKAQPATAAA